MPFGGALTLGLAGAGVLTGGIQAISGASQAKRAKRDLLNQISNQSVYQPSEYAMKNLAEAQARENAKAASVKYGESMLSSGLANAQANVNRNASSGAQALAMGSANQGQYNQGLMNLGQLQNEYNQQALQNTSAARNTMIGEGDKAFASRRQKEDMYANLYAGQLASGNAMLGQGLSTVASGLMSAAQASGDIDWSKKNKPLNLTSIDSIGYKPLSTELSGPAYRYAPLIGGQKPSQYTSNPFPAGTFDFWTK